MSNRKESGEIITLKIIDKSLENLVEKFDKLATEFKENKRRLPKKEK